MVNSLTIVTKQSNAPRYKHETINVLKSAFQQASVIGNKTNVKKLKTNNGVKDTFQEYFTDKLFMFQSKLRGTWSKKQAAVEEMLKSMPQEDSTRMSPVWRIKGQCLYTISSLPILNHVQVLILIGISQWKSYTSFYWALLSISGVMQQAA